MNRITVSCSYNRFDTKFRVTLRSRVSGEETVAFFHRDELEQARDAFTAALSTEAALQRPTPEELNMAVEDAFGRPGCPPPESSR